MGHNGCDGSEASGPWAIGSGYRFSGSGGGGVNGGSGGAIGGCGAGSGVDGTAGMALGSLVDIPVPPVGVGAGASCTALGAVPLGGLRGRVGSRA